MQALRVELLGQSKERSCLARYEAVAGELRMCETPKSLACGRQPKALVVPRSLADKAVLQQAGRLGLDQLTADGLQERMGDGGRSQRPQAGQAACRTPDKRVAREAAQEWRMVVVRGQNEAHLVQRRVSLRGVHADDERPVRALTHLSKRRSPSRLECHREDAVAEHARGVTFHPRRKGE